MTCVQMGKLLKIMIVPPKNIGKEICRIEFVCLEQEEKTLLQPSGSVHVIIHFKWRTLKLIVYLQQGYVLFLSSPNLVKNYLSNVKT